MGTGFGVNSVTEVGLARSNELVRYLDIHGIND